MKRIILKLQNSLVLKRIILIGVILFLFLYTFSIPAFSGRGGWHIISYFFMAALAGFTIVYILLFVKFKFNKWLIVPCAFVLFAFFGTAFYSHAFIPANGKLGWTTLILMLTTLIVFYYTFVAIGNKRLIVKTIVIAFAAFAIYFAIIYRREIVKFDISGSRIGDYFDNVNTIGFYFAIAFNLSLYISLFFEKRRELFYLIPTVICFVLGFFTGSRAFIVSVLSGSIVVLFIRLIKHKLIFLLVLAIIIGAFFGLMQLPALSFLKEQFERTIYTIFGIGNSKIDTSTVQRIIWPDYGFYLGGKNLIFGYGVNGFSIYSGIGTYAHNNYAEVICNFGLIGFVLFNACYIIPLLFSIKSQEKDVRLVWVLFFTFFFRNFFGVSYYSKEAYLLLALIIFLTKDCKMLLFKYAKVKTPCFEVNI